MSYEVDENYPFVVDDYGFPYLPEGLKKDGELYVLPNGKYLPCGCYQLEDGSNLIYEPRELSFFSKLLRENVMSS